MLNRKQYFWGLGLVCLLQASSAAGADAPAASKETTRSFGTTGDAAERQDTPVTRIVSGFQPLASDTDYLNVATAREAASLYGTVHHGADDDPLQVEHHDNSLLRRLGRLRSLSFVTLMRTDKTRVFFGVTKEGHPGIYFATQPQHLDDARHLELYRLPYVNYDE